MDTKQAILNQIDLMNQSNAKAISTSFEMKIDGERYDIYLSITRREADDDI